MLKKLFNEQNIIIIEESNYGEVLEILFNLLKKNPDITDFETFKEAILEREKIVSTGIGLGLAIPHTRNNVVKNFVLGALLIKKGVEWKSIDDSLVNFVIMVGSPEHTHKEYLHLLAELVLMWKNNDIRKKIINSKTSKEIIEIINSFN